MTGREWITVAHAAELMGVCKRQALRLLWRRDADLDGRLLRRVGVKRMPRGDQPSKLLVCVALLCEAMRPDDVKRDIDCMKLEIALLRQQLSAIRRALSARRSA